MKMVRMSSREYVEVNKENQEKNEVIDVFVYVQDTSLYYSQVIPYFHCPPLLIVLYSFVFCSKFDTLLYSHLFLAHFYSLFHALPFSSTLTTRYVFPLDHSLSLLIISFLTFLSALKRRYSFPFLCIPDFHSLLFLPTLTTCYFFPSYLWLIFIPYFSCRHSREATFFPSYLQLIFILYFYHRHSRKVTFFTLFIYSWFSFLSFLVDTQETLLFFSSLFFLIFPRTHTETGRHPPKQKLLSHPSPLIIFLPWSCSTP